MKRIYTAVLVLALCAALFAGCAAGGGGAAGAQSGGETNKSAATLSGTIVEVDERTLLLAGTDGALYEIPTDGVIAELAQRARDEGVDPPIAPGNELTVGFGGDVMETYPAQIGSVETASAVSGDDLVGLYLSVIDRLWQIDDGLNADADYLAFDLSGATNLSEGEKAAVIWLAATRRGLTPLSGTFDELVEQGYIDGEQLYFEKGLLYVFTLDKVGTDSFCFDAQKWRSGLGAYFFMDCTATLKNGEWSYEIGAEAIS